MDMTDYEISELGRKSRGISGRFFKKMAETLSKHWHFKAKNKNAEALLIKV